MNSGGVRGDHQCLDSVLCVEPLSQDEEAMPESRGDYFASNSELLMRVTFSRIWCLHVK